MRVALTSGGRFHQLPTGTTKTPLPRRETRSKEQENQSRSKAVAESRSNATVVASNSVAPRAEKSAQAKLIYRVKSGDTLSSIAKVFQTSVASLKQWNRLRTNSIRVGDRLTVFPNRATAND